MSGTPEVKAADAKSNGRCSCATCGRTFRNSAYFARHQARKTPCTAREAANPCTFCNRVFITESGLVRHQKKCDAKLRADEAAMMKRLDVVEANLRRMQADCDKMTREIWFAQNRIL